MPESPITLVILRGELERKIAELAAIHAAFEPSRRRVLMDDGAFALRVAADVVALTVRPDGTICDLLVRSQALSEAWIENAFVRAAS